ncbi:MAG: hypothetical protein IPK99_07510 [Flavobacteriales bacterium]|nr:hypothetical protein [Flavobacteriales bacterium]
MRNVLLALFCTIALATAVHAQQQVANGGFEDWSQVTLYEEIGTWTTINGQLPSDPTTTKVPGYAGSWATHLETRTVGLSTAFGYILQGEVVNDLVTGGVPFTTPIDAIEGWYRYDLQPGDSAVVLVGIWSTGVLAVLDVHTIGGSQPAWTAFSLPVNQGVPIAPDSVVVAVTSSNPFVLGAAAGSWIEVDDVALTSFIEPNPQELVNADMEAWIDVQIEQADDWSSFDPYLAAVGFTSVTKDNTAYAVLTRALLDPGCAGNAARVADERNGNAVRDYRGSALYRHACNAERFLQPRAGRPGYLVDLCCFHTRRCSCRFGVQPFHRTRDGLGTVQHSHIPAECAGFHEHHRSRREQPGQRVLRGRVRIRVHAHRDP